MEEIAPPIVGTSVGDNVGVEGPKTGAVPAGVIVDKPARSTEVCVEDKRGTVGFRQM